MKIKVISFLILVFSLTASEVGKSTEIQIKRSHSIVIGEILEIKEGVKKEIKPQRNDPNVSDIVIEGTYLQEYIVTLKVFEYLKGANKGKKITMIIYDLRHPTAYISSISVLSKINKGEKYLFFLNKDDKKDKLFLTSQFSIISSKKKEFFFSEQNGKLKKIMTFKKYINAVKKKL